MSARARGDFGGENALCWASEVEGRDTGDFCAAPRIGGRLPEATRPAGAFAWLEVDAVLTTGRRGVVVVPVVVVAPEAALALAGFKGALPVSFSSGFLTGSFDAEGRVVVAALLTSRWTSGLVATVTGFVCASPGLSFLCAMHV